MKLNCYSLLFILFIFSPFFNISQTFTEITGLGGEYEFTEYTYEHGVMFIGGNELYISNDDGLSWFNVDNSAGSILEDHLIFGAVALSPNKYCILTEKSSREYIFLSTNGGTTWTEQFQSLSDFSNTGNIIDASNDTLMIPIPYGVLRSVDGGLNWAEHVFSTAYPGPELIIFNDQSQLWYTATEDEGIMTSPDNGDNWTQLNLGIDVDKINTISTFGTTTIFTVIENDYSDFYFISETGVIEKTLSIPRAALEGSGTGNAKCFTSGMTPSGVFMTESNEAFYYVDTLTEDIFYYNYPGFNNVANAGLELGPNKGVGFRSDNFTSEAYLIDYNVAPDIYPPAKFKILNNNSTCAGDDIVVSVYTNSADSVRWYVDNQYHSTGNTATIATPPNTFVTYSIRCEAFYNGTSVEHTKSKSFYAPQSPDTFSYGVDETPCYASNVIIDFIGSSVNSGNTTMEIVYNGSTIYGPQQLQNSISYAFIQNISVSDSILFITRNAHPCNGTADTTYQYLDVGPNLLDFDWTDGDTAICLGETVRYDIFNTNSIWDYTVSTDYTLDTYYNQNGQTFDGMPNDTITYFSQQATVSDTDVGPETLNPIYMYLNIEVETWGGCSQEVNIDTVRVYRPSSFFRIHQKTYEVGTPLEISNYIPVGNRIWSSNTLPSPDLNQVTDTVPHVNSSTPGFYDLTLKNEPYPGCSDERTEYVQYAERSPLVDNCSIKYAPSVKKILQTEYDRDGNLYSLGVVGAGNNYNNGTIYSLEKFSGTDSVLWSIEGGYLGGYIFGAVIQGIDFDKENNVICVGWLSYEDDYYDDGIMVSDPGTFTTDVNLYIFKLDGDDGSLIWKREITEMPINVPGNSSRIRTTDVAVSEDYIYVSTYHKTSLQLIALNLDGEYIDHGEMNTPFSSSYDFLSQRHLMASSGLSYSRDTYRSPKLNVLSNGDLIALGKFRSVPSSSSYPQLNLGNTSEFGIFAMKYNVAEGIHDVETISTQGFAQTSTGISHDFKYSDPIFFDVDENDNIYVSSYARGRYFKDHEKISALDSVLYSMPLSYIFKMDSGYNKKWVTTGTHSIIEGLSYNQKTKDILVSGIINQTVGFSSDSVHLFSGDTMVVIHDTSSYMHTSNPNYAINRDAYLAKFDTSGNPTFIEVFDFLDSPLSGRTYTSLATSPCGDYVMSILTYNSNWAIDGDTLLMDSTFMVLGSPGCNFDCKLFIPDDTLRLCVGTDTLRVFPKDYYRIDSISYTITNNGSVVVSNQYAQMVNGALEVPIPSQLANNDSTLVISYDNSLSADSTIVFYIAPPEISYLDTICEADTLTVNFNSSAFTYVINDTVDVLGNTYSIPFNQQYIGENSFPLLSTHINDILCYDTVSYQVNYSPDDVTYTYDSLFCDGESVTFEAFSPYNYDYDWIINGTTGTQNTLDPWDYTVGDNELYVLVTHYNGCQLTDTIEFSVEDCASLKEFSKTEVIVSPNPNNGSFVVKLQEEHSINEVLILDAAGRTLDVQKSQNKQTLSFDLGLSAGTYYVQFEVDQRRVVKRFIVK